MSLDSDSCLPLFDTHIMDSIPVQRSSRNIVINNRGKKLLNRCKQCGLRILNGLMLSDSLGQYTSHQPSGRGVIDYFIASESIINLVVYNYVHNLQAD